jgi:hypothetical protein
MILHALSAPPSALDADVRRALEAGPWCWPAADHPDLVERARALAPSPRPAGIGEVLLVSVGDCGDAVWGLREDGDGPPFGAKALRAWRDAATALPQALPLLWTSVRAAAATPPRPVLLGRMSARDPAAPVEAELDGASFGLAFALALTSRVFAMPAPADVAALAAVQSDGRVDRVEALGDKIRALADWTPAVRALLVAAEQRDEAERWARRCGLEARVRGVRSVAQALDAVWGERLAEHLVLAGRDPAGRRAILDSLLALVLVLRGAVPYWRPVHDAATLVLERWTDLDADERWRLQCVRAIAARHDNRFVPLELPAERLALLPAPLRLRLVAHFVQHASDTGSPSFADARPLAERYLVDGDEAHEAHLQLLGALGRLEALRGDAASALRRQESAALGFAARFALSDISYPLAEWFRLAGALGDGAAFERAEAFRHRIDRLGGLGLDGSAFVDLARLRALVALGRVDEAAIAELRALACDRCSPSHVAASATRWLARCVPFASVTWETGDLAQHFRTLAELDRALDEGAPTGAIVARLEAWMPAAVRALRSSAPDPGCAAAYLARFFPY